MDAEASKTERDRIMGASSGIGLATSVGFADRGVRIALLAREIDGLHSSADQVRAAGGDPLVTPASVTDRVALEVAVERATRSLCRSCRPRGLSAVGDAARVAVRR